LKLESVDFDKDTDWAYSAYHHSHPILSERLNALGYKSSEKVKVAEKDSKSDAVASGREL